jgi:hydroxylamine reductase
LTGALVTLAKVALKKGRTETAGALIIEGLFATVTNVSFDDDAIKTMIDTVHAERLCIFPGSAQCEDFDPQKIWNTADDIRSLRACSNCGFLRPIDRKNPRF